MPQVNSARFLFKGWIKFISNKLRVCVFIPFISRGKRVSPLLLEKFDRLIIFTEESYILCELFINGDVLFLESYHFDYSGAEALA